MGRERRGGLPGNLSDERFELFGLISPGERPAHVAGGVTHIGTNAACSPLFLIGQGLDDEWHNCKRTTEQFYLRNKSLDQSMRRKLCPKHVTYTVCNLKKSGELPGITIIHLKQK